jgi:hypothetical protein
MISTHRDHPILALVVEPAEDPGREKEIEIGVQEIARPCDLTTIVADVDLAETDVNTVGPNAYERPLERGAGLCL